MYSQLVALPWHHRSGAALVRIARSRLQRGELDDAEWALARLLQLGYRRLRLLGDLSDVQFTDEVEVQVEAERNGMPCKGRVVSRNGSVSDVHIQTVAQSFP